MAGESEGPGLGRWWAATLAALMPAVVVAGWGAMLLVRQPTPFGGAVAGVGLLLFLVHVFGVQRAIDRSLVPPPPAAASEPDSPALTFARRALRLRRVEEVGALLSTTVHQALAMERTLLVLPEPGAVGARVLGDTKASASAADDAYGYLAAHHYPVRRDEADPEAEAVRQLCARLDVEVALGLRHRGELLGVLLLGHGQRPLGDRDLDLLQRLGLQATVAIANTHLYDEARGRASLSREVDLATAVVEHLLPPETVQRAGDITVRGLCRPAAECGGDFWFWRRLADGRGLLVIGDVTGHGLPAAIVAATAKGCCEAVVASRGENAVGPADLLTALNRAVFHAGCGRYHMSCFAAMLDDARREVRFANAGHNFPYVVTPRAGEPPHLGPLIARGNTLGQVERAGYTEATRPLAAGERLVFYTDGVVEAPSETGEQYGEKRFRRVLVERGADPVEAFTTALYRTVADHMGARPPADDITLVVAALEPGTGGAIA